MIKRADSARGAPAPLRISCRVDVELIARPNSRRFFSTRKSAGNHCSRCSLVPSDYCETVLVRSSISLLKSPHRAWRHIKFSAFAIGRFASWTGVHIDSAKDINRQPIAFHRTGDAAVYTSIQRVSHQGDQPSLFSLRALFVRCFATAKLALPRLSSDTQRHHSPMSTERESNSTVPSRSSVQLLPVWLAWSGFAPFPPSSSPQSPLVDARERPGSSPAVVPPRLRSYVLLFTSNGTSASSSSSPLPPFVQYSSFPRTHALPRVLVLTPRRIRIPSGPDAHLHSLFAARKAYPDPEWSSRSPSLAIRRQEGVSGPRVVQPFIFIRHPPPRRRIWSPNGPAVNLYSPSAARKAYPDSEGSRRSSSLAIHRRGRHIWTASGPGVYLHSLSAARKAYPDPEWSSRPSSLTIRCQKGVSGPPMVQAFILARYLPPGRRIRTPSGPAVHLYSLFAAREAYPEPGWSSRSSSLAIRCREGVSGPRAVQAFIFDRYPLPGRRFRTPSGPAVHLHSLSAARKA